jgi:hypothetical protein
MNKKPSIPNCSPGSLLPILASPHKASSKSPQTRDYGTPLSTLVYVPCSHFEGQRSNEIGFS